MSDDFFPSDEPIAQTPELPELTVSEISQAVKKSVEKSFYRVRIRGELSGVKLAASGHLYYALKDEHAVLDGVCWRGTVQRLALHPEDGLEVICTGKLTTYPGRSKYQIVAESMEVAGEGALLAILEKRKKQLAEEGLFDPTRKQQLPFLPTTIGVVTSPTGAVIRDILHRLSDRFPCHVVVWPVLVQGDGAAEQVAEAIQSFNAIPEGAEPGPIPRPDVLIVARGGGSLEDLWCFNEEIVVRAAADSAIPLISAVGHETDTTLIDFASDQRAPTPTAAAEMAVPVRAELLARTQELAARSGKAVFRYMDHLSTQLMSLSRGLGEPQQMVNELQQRVDDWGERLAGSLKSFLQTKQSGLDVAFARLKHPKEAVVEAKSRLSQAGMGLDFHLKSLVQARANELKGIQLSALRHSLVGKVQLGEQQLHAHSERLGALAEWQVHSRGENLTALSRLLESFSFHSTLQRGFALVRDDEGNPLLSQEMAEPGMEVSLEFHDGRKLATVNDDRSRRGKPAKKQQSQSAVGVNQGDLFS